MGQNFVFSPNVPSHFSSSSFYLCFATSTFSYSSPLYFATQKFFHCNNIYYVKHPLIMVMVFSCKKCFGLAIILFCSCHANHVIYCSTYSSHHNRCKHVTFFRFHPIGNHSCYRFKDRSRRKPIATCVVIIHHI